jgi:hypothetical protein
MYIFAAFHEVRCRVYGCRLRRDNSPPLDDMQVSCRFVL